MRYISIILAFCCIGSMWSSEGYTFSFDANAQPQYASLHEAVKNGDHFAVYAKLLHYNISTLNTPDEDGNTPLHIAVSCGYYRITYLLLSHGVSPDLIHRVSGNTPLVTAVYKGYTDIVRLLLRYRASPQVGRACGSFPIAIFAEHVAIANNLIHAGALSSTIEHDTQTIYPRLCLHYALHRPHFIHLCLQHGAYVNQYMSGKTPLHSAIFHGDPQGVRTLLSYGASPEMIDHDHKTAYACAREREQQVINNGPSYIPTLEEPQKDPSHQIRYILCEILPALHRQDVHTLMQSAVYQEGESLIDIIRIALGQGYTNMAFYLAQILDEHGFGHALVHVHTLFILYPATRGQLLEQARQYLQQYAYATLHALAQQMENYHIYGNIAYHIFQYYQSYLSTYHEHNIHKDSMLHHIARSAHLVDLTPCIADKVIQDRSLPYNCLQDTPYTLARSYGNKAFMRMLNIWYGLLQEPSLSQDGQSTKCIAHNIARCLDVPADTYTFNMIITRMRGILNKAIVMDYHMQSQQMSERLAWRIVSDVYQTYPDLFIDKSTNA